MNGTIDLKEWISSLHDWRRRPRETTIAAGVVLLGMLTSGALVTRNRDLVRIPTTEVKRGPVTIKVSESGELRAQNQVIVSAIQDKQILWLAPEGKFVRRGDTLVVLESEKYVISTGVAQSALQIERANLEKAQNDVEAQQAKEDAARKHYETLPALAKKGFVQESEVEEARLAYVELKARTRSLVSSVNAARASVDRAARAVAQEERKLKQGVIYAPSEGLVVYATSGSEEEAHKISVGMTPFEGQDLMFLPDISSMLVETQISEVDVSKVKVGQPAIIRVDAYPGVTFHGEVKSIGNLAKRKINRATGKATAARVFDLTIKVLAKDPRLKPGLTASADIIVNEYPDVVYLPMEAVFFDEKDQPVVYVKKGGRIETRPVELGESNDRVTIISKGVEPGKIVLLGRPGPA
jgi:multidrug efflux pump subunit AcrA (membrane-fusion protein)